MKVKKPIVILLLIILIFLIKGLYFILLIPPWEAPDEGGHIKYVTYIYLNHRIPNSNTSGKTNSQSIDNSRSLQNKILKDLKISKDSSKKELFKIKNYSLEFGVDNITFYPPLYYVYLLPFYSLPIKFSSYISFLIMRFGSLLLGSISLFFVYRINKIFFPKSETLPLIITFLVSAQPMFTFITSVVNNDNMVIFCFFLFVYFSLSILNRTSKRIGLLGILVGISSLVKPQLLIFIPLYLILLMTKLQDKNKKILYFVASIAIPFFWYVIVTHLSFSNAVVDKSVTPDQSLLLSYPIDFVRGKQITGLFITFFGDFGWLNVPMPKWVYMAFFILIAISTFGWIKYRKMKTNSSLNQINFLIVLSTLLTLSLVFFDILHYVNIHLFSLQGRYFLPLLPLLMIFIIKGFLLYPKKMNSILILSCLSVFIISQILMYTTISKFYYGRLVFIPPLTRVYK